MFKEVTYEDYVADCKYRNYFEETDGTGGATTVAIINAVNIASAALLLVFAGTAVQSL